LTNIDAELEAFSMDPGSGPQQVGQAHGADQLANFERHLWSAAATSRLPSLERTKTSTMRKHPVGAAGNLGMICADVAQAASAIACWLAFQFHGSSSSIRFAGWSGSFARTWASQACGSTSFNLHVSTRV
jgi:hypothetical protein